MRLSPGPHCSGSPLQFAYGRKIPAEALTNDENVNPRSPDNDRGPDAGLMSKKPAVILIGSAAAGRGAVAARTTISARRIFTRSDPSDFHARTFRVIDSWRPEREGHCVGGLAPTSRTAQKLAEAPIKTSTLQRHLTIRVTALKDIQAWTSGQWEQHFY